jgi:hypothetical protein
MTPQPDDQPPLTGREKTIAQEVVTLLESLLPQLDRKLDAISAQLETTLTRLDAIVAHPGIAPDDREAISQLIALHREFPAWAVWLPHRGGPWVATRMASSRAPCPGLPVVWVDGVSVTDLAGRMRSVDAQLAPP